MVIDFGSPPNLARNVDSTTPHCPRPRHGPQQRSTAQQAGSRSNLIGESQVHDVERVLATPTDREVPRGRAVELPFENLKADVIPVQRGTNPAPAYIEQTKDDLPAHIVANHDPFDLETTSRPPDLVRVCPALIPDTHQYRALAQGIETVESSCALQ
jgi:hypothetical protein